MSTKNDAESRRKAKLQAIVKNAHALSIQAAWRGHCTRKSMKMIAKQALSKLKGTKAANNQYDQEEIKIPSNFTQKRFEDVLAIVVAIEFGVGLPINVTATRVSAKIVDENRNTINPIGPLAYSHLDSDIRNPKFSYKMTWKKEDIAEFKSNWTLVVRVDTLERPSMRYKCAGYAALKLFIDSTGKQPSGGSLGIRLNAGRFCIPMVLGFVPVNVPFGEEVMEGLAPIKGSYLCLSMYEASESTFATESPPKLSEIIAKASINYPVISEGTVASILLNSLLFATAKIPEYSMNADANRYITGHSLTREETRDLFDSLYHWLNISMPSPQNIQQTLISKYMFRYDGSRDRAHLGVDMLYNLPRRNPLNITSNDKKIHCKLLMFKTSLQIIGGKRSKPEMIYNCSKQIRLESPELFPVYLDDLREFGNLSSFHGSALLIRVTAVDVFIYKDDHKHHAKEQDPDDSIGVALYSESQPEGHFWGLLNLFTDSPFSKLSHSVTVYADGQAPSDRDASDRLSFLNEGTHNVPLFEGLPPTSIIESEDPIEALRQTLQLENLKHSTSSATSWLTSPLRKPSNNSNTLKLSNGSTAIVRVVNSRMKRFGNSHLLENPTIVPVDDMTMAILQAYCGNNTSLRTRLQKKFEYNSLLCEPNAPMMSMLPKHFVYKTSNIIKKIDRLYESAHRLAQTDLNE